MSDLGRADLHRKEGNGMFLLAVRIGVVGVRIVV